MKPKKGSKELRKGRISLPGHSYFITTSAFRKKPLFKNDRCFSIMLESLKWLEERGRIELHFFVMMPNHLHLVIKLEEGHTLAEVMRSFKGYTGRKLKEQLGFSTPLYESQYYDHLIRKDESFIEIMRYCWYNPVRKGLVESPYDYPFCWSRYEL